MSYYESPSDLYGKSSGSGSPDPSYPKLRSDLVIRQLVQGKDLYYMIKDPPAQAYYKFTPERWEITSLFDGRHTLEQMVDEYNAKHPLEPVDLSYMRAYEQILKDMEFLQIGASEKSLMLMQKIREQRKHRTERTGSIFFITIPLADPNDFLDRVIPYLRFLFTRKFFYFSFACILMMLVINFLKWEEFKEGTIALYSFSQKSFWEIWVFIALMGATGTIHELGHGLMLKSYGGEVRQMGLLLFYLTPGFYCDTSDSYILTNRRERMWVTFAGTYSELFVCALASVVWYFSVPGTGLYEFAFTVILFTGISSFLINMNPLVKLDGYYAMMDYLGIPDLREDAFAHISGMIKKNLFGLQVDPVEGLTSRRRRIYLIYGFFAILYTAFVYYLIFGWVRNIFVNSFGSTGYFLLVIVLYLMFRKKLHQLGGFLRYSYLDKKEVLMKRKTLMTGAFSGAVLLFLLLVPRTHMKVESPFVIEPIQKVEIRNEAEGFITEVLVKENDFVERGQVLAKIRNPDLERRYFDLVSRLALVDRELPVLGASDDASRYQMKVREQKQFVEERTELTRKINSLVLRAPIEGKVVTARLEDRIGAYLKEGNLFCEIADLERVKVQLPVREYEIEDIKPGQRVKVKVDAFPFQTYQGEVWKISPAISERVEALEGTYSKLMVTAIIDNADGKLLPGMGGTAKVFAEKYSVAGRIFRELFRWVRSRVW